MMTLNNDNLLKFLKDQGLDAQLQPETNQVYVLYKFFNHDFPLFFRIYEGGEMLQLLVFFPLQIKNTRFDAVGRLLHLLNKEIDIPGFGIDENVGLVFHRIMIPCIDKKVDEKLLGTYVSSIPKICEQFVGTIAGTASSDLNFDEILKKGKEKQQK